VEKYGIQEDDDIPEVGAWEQDFFTTHSEIVNLSLTQQLDAGKYYIPFKFEIDRHQNLESYDNISVQKKSI
jgi:hypothetical protein